ncbi:hypothetical protein ACFVVX_36155 [Kitasatospora sp. NPDC058170]|uniref:hypothetical protein n=1 Tax=Kitasatospora sp. NPDC058170 TaxID=3346364 RepID=UPI0036D77369
MTYGQARRQATLRRRRLDQQTPRLRQEARKLLEEIGPQPAAAGQSKLETMDGEQLAQVVRHARTARDHLTALHDALGTEHGPAGARAASDGSASATGARPAARGPRPGPGQQPVPTELISLLPEPRTPTRTLTATGRPSRPHPAGTACSHTSRRTRGAPCRSHHRF